MSLIESPSPQLMVPLSGCELYARPCLRGAALERVPKFANISQIWLKYRNLANFGRFVSRRSRKRMHSRQLCTEARASSFCSFWLKHMAWFLLQSEHFYSCNGFLPSCSYRDSDCEQDEFGQISKRAKMRQNGLFSTTCSRHTNVPCRPKAAHLIRNKKFLI